MSLQSIIIILVILIIVILLLVVMMSNLNKDTKPKKSNKISKGEMNIAMPNVYSITFPPKVEHMGKREVGEIVKKIFDPFRYIDYKSMDSENINKKDWHTWQVSILLLSYKYKEEFFLTNQEAVFPKFLLNSTENDIKSLMTSIIKKYSNYVEPNKPKDELCKDYIWTNRDACIIFYFLANFKKYKSDI